MALRLLLLPALGLLVACGSDDSPSGSEASRAGSTDASATAGPAIAELTPTPTATLPPWVQGVLANPPTPAPVAPPSGGGGGGSSGGAAPTPAPSGGGGAQPAPTAPPAAPPPRPAGALRSVTLSSALGGASRGRPIELGAYPGGLVYLAEQDGRVSLLRLDGSNAGTLLDIRSKVSRASNEEGFLSLALDPGFPGRPYIYAYYSAAGGERRTVLTRFEVANNAANPASEIELLSQAQPFSNHKGGAIRFGPDGMLYLGLGDGGSQGDPNGNGQNLGTLLGKIIRIDVRNVAPGRGYAAPSDNPFVSTGGARPEVWAYGLRNPWRMAFDPATGALWVGDVGQGNIEEIDVVQRGGNYGWNRFEGTSCYRGPCPGGMLGPVAEYTHASGCSVTGGVVYRGSALPALAGHYLYADFCSGRVWALGTGGGAPVQVASGAGNVASFGTDAAGEVYLLIHGGPIRKITAAE